MTNIQADHSAKRASFGLHQIAVLSIAVALFIVAALLMRWDWIPHYIGLFVSGFSRTILLLIVSCVAGFALAIPIALAMAVGPFWLSAPAKFFCSVMRGTPLLLQIWMLYYGLGSLFPLFPELRASIFWPYLRDALPYAILALTLNFGAYEAEVMRGAFVGVDRGQLEAAKAFGVRRLTTFRRIWFPLAFYRALPTLTGEVVLQLKSTPLVATISVVELFGASSRVRQETYLTYEPLLIVALVYICITGIIVMLSRRIERRLPVKIG